MFGFPAARWNMTAQPRDYTALRQRCRFFSAAAILHIYARHGIECGIDRKSGTLLQFASTDAERPPIGVGAPSTFKVRHATGR
jgi:hypothetical protein